MQLARSAMTFTHRLAVWSHMVLLNQMQVTQVILQQFVPTADARCKLSALSHKEYIWRWHTRLDLLASTI